MNKLNTILIFAYDFMEFDWAFLLGKNITDPSYSFFLKSYLQLSLTGSACWKVMLESRKFNLVHEIFRKMKKSGVAPKALTYKGSFFVPFVEFFGMFGQ